MFLGKDNLCCARSMYHPCGTDCARAGRQERVQSTHTNTWGCIDPRDQREEGRAFPYSLVSRQPSAHVRVARRTRARRPEASRAEARGRLRRFVEITLASSQD